MLYETVKELIMLGKEERGQWFDFLEKHKFNREDYVHIVSMFVEENIESNYKYMKLDEFIKFVEENIKQLSNGDFFRENITDMIFNIEEHETNSKKELNFKIWVVNKFLEENNLW